MIPDSRPASQQLFGKVEFPELPSIHYRGESYQVKLVDALVFDDKSIPYHIDGEEHVIEIFADNCKRSPYSTVDLGLELQMIFEVIGVACLRLWTDAAGVPTVA